MYFDIVHPFGLRSAAIACQRTTDAVRFLFASQGYSCVNYLDDIASCELPHRANRAHRTLGNLLQTLALEENTTKTTAPATIMTFLGIQLDTDNFQLSIPANKLACTRSILSRWSHKETATKQQLRSLLGTLQHISACIRPGRTFLNRMLNMLRSFPPDSRQINLDSEFNKDLFWWATCLQEFNGTSIIAELDWSHPDAIFSTDSSSRVNTRLTSKN